MNIEAMKQWLEALEYLHKEKCDYMTRNKLGDPMREDSERLAIPAITSLRAAITQAEQQGDDTARLDWLQSVARCDPKMDGNHVWWPLSFNVCSNIKGPNIRAAIDLARSAGEV